MTSTEFAALISAVAGSLISFLFFIVPGLSDWYYGEVGKKWRGLFMAGLGLLITGGIYLSLCVWNIAIPGVSVSCDQGGIVTMVLAFFAFLASNQSTYQVLPDSPAKKRVQDKSGQG